MIELKSLPGIFFILLNYYLIAGAILLIVEKRSAAWADLFGYSVEKSKIILEALE
jgi:hypothetical protein